MPGGEEVNMPSNCSQGQACSAQLSATIEQAVAQQVLIAECFAKFGGQHDEGFLSRLQGEETLP